MAEPFLALITPLSGDPRHQALPRGHAGLLRPTRFICPAIGQRTVSCRLRSVVCKAGDAAAVGYPGQLPGSDPGGSGWVYCFVPAYGWMWAKVIPAVPQDPARPDHGLPPYPDNTLPTRPPRIDNTLPETPEPK